MEINKETLNAYADLKLKEKAIKLELERLKGDVTEMVSEYIKENGNPPGIAGKGSFSIAEKKKWTYSVKVDALEEDLKALMDEEKADGSATAEISQTLTFITEK